MGEAGGASELEDVLVNLRHVLSTKRGSGHFLPDFGLTETGYRTQEEMVVELTRELKENIQRYEPRIKLVEIDDDYDDRGKARMVVHCELRSSGESFSFAIDPLDRSFGSAPASDDDS